MVRPKEPAHVRAELLGTEGETRHLVWRCPECGMGYSEDFESDDLEPLLASCGRSRHHADGQDLEVRLFWTHGDVDRMQPHVLE